MRLPRSRSNSDERRPFLDYSPPSPARTSASVSGTDIESLVDEPPLKKRSPFDRPRRSGLLSWAVARLRVARRSLRRSPLSILWLLIKYVPVVFLTLLVVTPLLAPSYMHPPAHYHELTARCRGKAAEPGCANSFDEKIFISVSLYDKGGLLSGGNWGRTVLELIHLIGASNVYLSIYQNDSGPQAARALAEFAKKVPCRHSIVNDAHVDMSQFPTVTMPDGSKRIKRLAYLSEMRNRALRPLDRMQEDKGLVRFDKVLFLNDVAFRPVDAAQLLFSTNVGPDGRTRYLTTCALDYDGALFYDLYAQRDAEGYSNGVPIFPIFGTAGRALSRADMLAQKDAVRVKSCWGGMVAMQARWVQNLNTDLTRPDFQAPNAHVIDPARPRNVTAPVRFRHEPEVWFDACECCLFLADVSQVARRAEARDVDTFVNPYVRVAYSQRNLRWLPWINRWERLLSVPQAVISVLNGLPTHNPHRTVEEGDGFMEEVWDVAKNQWKLEQRVGRNGMFCGVREMQLIREGARLDGRNWVNTRMPPGQTLNFPS